MVSAELTAMVRGIYHRFPSEHWERTRAILEANEPRRLFAHIESLISTRQIDASLKENEAFRKLAAEMYSARHPWLKDADLGQARWESFQEFSAGMLSAQAREAENDPETMLKMKRQIMLRRIREGKDVEMWRQLLGFQGVEFDEAEVRGDSDPAYGQGQQNEVVGVAISCIDGPDATYGPSSAGRSVKEFERPQQPAVPKAPAEGGQTLHNPFTTEWKARVAPDGWEYPAIFDPYFTSNQFIRRSNPYELPKIPGFSSDDEEETEQTATEEEEPREVSNPIGRAGQAVTIAKLRRTSTATSNHDQPGTSKTVTFKGRPGRGGREMGSISLLGGDEVRDAPRPLIPSFTISTRTHSRAVAQPGPSQPSQPPITVGRPTPTDQNAPRLFERLVTAEGTRPNNEPLAPLAKGRIFTPAREEISPSPSPTSSQHEDIEMADLTSEDVDMGDAQTTNDQTETAEQRWLADLVGREVTTSAEDHQMMSYRGWRIHSPKVQLARIKNFLADEDIDRTLNWERKFAEIGLFLQHCVRMPDATRKIWYGDLRECINMLHTHWVFEQHHYGERPLVVDFPELSNISARLPPVPGGRSIVVEKMPAEDVVRPRYLLHRVPESIQDVDYQIPGRLLRETFLTWFRQDGNLVWNADPTTGGAMPGSGDRGKAFGYSPDFNMALTEDEWFGKCMSGGPETTVQAIRGDANFYMPNSEFVPGGVDEVTVRGRTHRMQRMYPEGEAQQRFARYRGAKRAALQQCLSHFDSVENVAIQGPFRRLVLPPTRRQRELARERAGRNIVYKPHAIERPPEGTKLDPLGLTYWHQVMRSNHYERAEDARALTERDRRAMLTQTGSDTDPVFTPANFLGPVTPFSFLKESERKAVTRYKRLCEFRDKLTRAYNRAPRQMLEGMLKNIELGLRGEPSWDMQNEIAQHLKKYGKFREVDDMEMHWLQFVCGPSTNEKMEREPLPKLGREFDVFVTRIQTLLDDPNKESLLAKQEKKADVMHITLALNAGLREGDFVLREDMVGKYCKVLANRGRLGYEVDKGRIMISRPTCDWHPEHRLNWPEGDDPWDAQTNIWNAANLPPPEDTWIWEEAFANIDWVNTSARLTKDMLWSRAYRVGVELDNLEEQLRQLDLKLDQAQEWDDRAVQLQDVAGMWKGQFDRGVPGRGPSVSYVSVVKAGDPGKFKEGMTEAEAYEIVRKGIIDELSEGNSTLWPARPRFSTVGDGDDDKEEDDEVMTLHRERVWDWARPEVAGVKKQFFSVNRWPVHLQTEKRQEQIRRSVEDKKRLKDEEKAEEKAEMEKMEEEVRPTAEDVASAQRAEIERMLSVPYHERDERTMFFPGQTEFWGGDTVSQRRAMEAHVQRTFESKFIMLGEATQVLIFVADSRTPADNTGHDGADDPRSTGSDSDGTVWPDVNSPNIPRSVPDSIVRGSNWYRSQSAARPARVEGLHPPDLLHPYPEQQEENRRRVRFEDDGIE
ncbi:uncharacterized protein CTRU02_209598 [Colletotrichum truncatum]|uniref:Uncharacterized protein n=1 Tax=Colletotrichum truncatum TaxID=5467 RepID=A0ACC3YT19_COLTU|nr:uncharacterized protein CTRU02_12099 [Colletotrichum truncatum]KAF6785167.1 hypothetical protein CTRU02_12099 [Colletotrichum truncatum]